MSSLFHPDSISIKHPVRKMKANLFFNWKLDQSCSVCFISIYLSYFVICYHFVPLRLRPRRFVWSL